MASVIGLKKEMVEEICRSVEERSGEKCAVGYFVRSTVVRYIRWITEGGISSPVRIDFFLAIYL